MKWEVKVPIMTTHVFEVEADTEAEAIEKGLNGGVEKWLDVHQLYEVGGDCTVNGEAEASPME